LTVAGSGGSDLLLLLDIEEDAAKLSGTAVNATIYTMKG
jgi:hypothetical protein